MRIALVGNFELDRQHSMQAFAGILHSGLKQRGFDVRLWKPQPICSSIVARSAPNGLSKWSGYVDKFVLFPRDVQKISEWADLVHICDHSNAMYIGRFPKIPNLVTCHDLIAVRSAIGEIPEHRTRWTGRILQKWILDGLRRAEKIVCVSNSTKDDVIRLTNVGERRVVVVYNGLNFPHRRVPNEESQKVLARHGIDPSRPYILHIGGNQWYKNRAGVLKIYNELRGIDRDCNASLVLIGETLPSSLNDFVRANRLDSHVFVRSNVPAADLSAFYSAAQALLFPSLLEGFGWPIIEAQACGCPVVTSARTPMTEIGGESADYVDPENHRQGAMTVFRVLNDRTRSQSPGINNSLRFSVDRMISGYVDVYTQVLGQHKA